MIECGRDFNDCYYIKFILNKFCEIQVFKR